MRSPISADDDGVDDDVAPPERAPDDDADDADDGTDAGPFSSRVPVTSK